MASLHGCSVEGGYSVHVTASCWRFVSRARRLWTVDYFNDTGTRGTPMSRRAMAVAAASTSRRCPGEAWLRRGAGRRSVGGDGVTRSWHRVAGVRMDRARTAHARARRIRTVLCLPRSSVRTRDCGR